MLAAHPRKREPVQRQDVRVFAADDEKCRCAHRRKGVSGEIRPTAARNYGADVLRARRRADERRGGRARAEAALRQALRRRVPRDPVARRGQPAREKPDIEVDLRDRTEVLFLGGQKVEEQRGEPMLVQERRDLAVARAEAARPAAVREEDDAKRVLRDAKVGLQFHTVGGDAHIAHASWTETGAARFVVAAVAFVSKVCRRDFSGTTGTTLASASLMPEQRTPLKDKDILLAVEDCRRLERILAGHRLTIPHSVEEAKLELERREFHMVILGVLFDESRMFELLRLVRTFDKNRLTPVACVLATESRLSDVAIEGLDHAVKAMLANAFLNLNKFPDNEEGNARLRRIVDYLILIDGDMHGGFRTVHDEG